jgi:hypothetical protein
MEMIRIKLKNLIKIFKIREKMSPPIPLVMRIVILFDWRMEFFCVSLGPKILILKSIGGQINFNSRWLLKDEEAIDWRRGFRSFHWARGTSSKKVMETFQGRRESLGWGVFVFWEKKKKMECVISFYVKGVVHERDVCKN